MTATDTALKGTCDEAAEAFRDLRRKAHRNFKLAPHRLFDTVDDPIMGLAKAAYSLACLDKVLPWLVQLDAVLKAVPAEVKIADSLSSTSGRHFWDAVSAVGRHPDPFDTSFADRVGDMRSLIAQMQESPLVKESKARRAGAKKGTTRDGPAAAFTVTLVGLWQIAGRPDLTGTEVAMAARAWDVETRGGGEIKEAARRYRDHLTKAKARLRKGIKKDDSPESLMLRLLLAEYDPQTAMVVVVSAGFGVRHPNTIPIDLLRLVQRPS